MDWPTSWYPIYPSHMLASGQVQAVTAFGKSLAVFRGRDGQAGLLDARCHHFGADLASGIVTTGGLKCPLHGRVFSAQGICTATQSKQRSWPLAEAYGLIFTYLGSDSPPTLPAPEGMSVSLTTKPRISTAKIPLAYIGANAFDTGHLKSVHGRELIKDAEITSLEPDGLRISFQASVIGTQFRDRLLRTMGINSVQIDTDCWGGNFLIFHHRKVGTWTLHAALPVDNEQTRVFTVSGTANNGWKSRIRLNLHHRFAMNFIKEDDRSLRGATAGEQNLDDKEDATLIRYLSYFASLPRSQP